MQSPVGVFCPSLNVCGGGEFVAIAIANTLAQNNQKVTLFANSGVDLSAIKDFFGETLNSSILTIKQPTYFPSRSLADFYQTALHSYIAKTKSSLFIDVFSNCVFPWANITYIHYPYLNHRFFRPRFPYLENPSLLQAGTIPHVLLEKNLVSYDDKLVLANSRYTAEEIKQYSKKTAHVLYPPYSSVISELGKQTTKNPTENLVVTISRIEPTKLLERIPYIAAQTPRSTNYAVVGRLYNKQTLTYLQNLTKKLGVTDRVKFYPDASSETKIALLQKARVYLHTMVGEHFGIATVEAMALGCIPIVHNSGGMKEFVPNRCRYETLPEAVDKVTSAIENWSTEESNAAKTTAEQFSISNFSKRFLQLYSEYNN